jgi:hypothetical protein
VITAHGGERVTLTQREIAETTPLVDWTVIRPAPTARRPAEVDLARVVVDALARSGDPRLAALGTGARLAIDWATDGGPAPVTGVDVGIPCVHDIAKESARAGRVAGDKAPAAATASSDRGRIVARGIQEWLAWAYLQGYPLPLWLVGAMPASEIYAHVLGCVGLGPDGMDGPVSTVPFASTVAARIAEVRIA